MDKIKQIQSYLNKYSTHWNQDQMDLEEDEEKSPIYYWDYHEEMGHGVEWSGWLDDENDNTVFETNAEIFEDGFMKNQEDINGLEVYLKQMNIIPDDAEIRDRNKHYFGDSFR